MKPFEIRPGIYWVGGIDWNLRNFHGYLTQRGSTYNAYLIVDEKITLVDTVKHSLVDEMLARISVLVDPAAIDVVVSNHVEMDHSGGLPAIMAKAPNALIITSAPKGEEGLKIHYQRDWKMRAVKSGERYSLGKRSLTFLQAPMVHWPDNMLSYMPEEKLLFSNDAFGQHLATSERFADEISADIVFNEAKKYYANIVLPYGHPVQKTLTAAADLDIKMIAPSHGLIWRKDLSRILAEYQKWSKNETVEKACVIYDTMWHSTEKMAQAISSAFEDKGIRAALFSLQHNHISDVMSELIDARYICVGSPTLNNTILPTVSAFLTYMTGLAPKGRKGLAFGSYGWGGQSTGIIDAWLKSANVEMLGDPLKVRYVPTHAQLTELKASAAALL